MPTTHQPNLLFCLFDSLSLADSGLSNPVNDLPHLMALSQTSTMFTRAYAPCPESSPARASLFTGLDPCVHGLWTNGVTLRSMEQTFAQRLQCAGYSNALVGRYQLSGVSRWTTEKLRQSEFSHTEWAHGPLHRSRQNQYLSWLENMAPAFFSNLFPSQANPDNTSLTDEQLYCLETLPNELSFNFWVGEKIGRWINKQSEDKPFLALAGFCVGSHFGAEPHHLSDGESVHLSALKQADSAIGKLLEQLKHSNRADDTVIIVASARGNADPTDESTLLKERSTNVPLLIHQPKQQQQRQHQQHHQQPLTIDSLVSTIDIAPTVLDLVNAPINPRMQGQSLLHIMNGRDEPRNWVLSRFRHTDQGGKYSWQSALCTESMKLVIRHGQLDEEKQTLGLYDLNADPLEQNNLAQNDSHASILEKMIDKMIDARCAMEDRTEPRIAEF